MPAFSPAWSPLPRASVLQCSFIPPCSCDQSARPWDWLPCDWLRPITKEATSKTRRVRPWDWLPCDWMRPITKEATSKTHPHYDSLQTTAMASSFLRLPSPMGLMVLNHRGTTATFGFLSRLYSLAGLDLRDRMDCWSFGVSFFVPCPLK